MKKIFFTVFLACMFLSVYSQNNNTEWWENFNGNNSNSNVQTENQNVFDIDYAEYLTIYGGMSLSNFTGEDSKHMSNGLGPNIGFTYGGMMNKWHLEVGMFYNKVCTEYDYDGECNISMNFIEMEMLAGYSPYKKNGNVLLINAGLGYNLGYSAPMKAKDGSYLLIGDGDKVDLFGDKYYDGLYDAQTLTIILGTTFRLNNGFTGRILYHMGMRDLSKGDNAPSFFLNYWEFSLGYAFKL